MSDIDPEINNMEVNYDGEVVCAVDDTIARVGDMCKWPTAQITWSIKANLPSFSAESFKAACELAWSYWVNVSGIRPMFVPSPQANVVIGLQTLTAGGVLADMQLPCGVSMQTSLQMRIDTSEDWVVSENPPANRVDLIRVLCHELGHAIGIPHIDGQNLMAPVYSAQIRKPLPNDIAQAVARYGLPAPTQPPPSPTDEWMEVAEVMFKNGKTYVRV